MHECAVCLCIHMCLCICIGVCTACIYVDERSIQSCPASLEGSHSGQRAVRMILVMQLPSLSSWVTTGLYLPEFIVFLSSIRPWLTFHHLSPGLNPMNVPKFILREDKSLGCMSTLIHHVNNSCHFSGWCATQWAKWSWFSTHCSSNLLYGTPRKSPPVPGRELHAWAFLWLFTEGQRHQWKATGDYSIPHSFLPSLPPSLLHSPLPGC